MVDAAVQQQPRHRVHGPVVAQGRSRAGQPGQVDRGAGVDERQGHELGEPAGAVLDAGQGAQVGDPVPGVVDVAVHHGGAARQTESVRGLDHLDPRTRRQLALGQHPADVVVEDLRRRARDGAQAGVADLGQPVGDARPGPGGRADDLHRAERVHVHARRRGQDGADDVGVGARAQVGADAGLDAHLGRAELLRLGGPAPDLLQRQRVRVGVGGSLGERAEPAADVADVGDVDVPVDHVGDVVADGVTTHGVGERGDRVEVGAVAADQGEVLGVGEPGGVGLGPTERDGHVAGAQQRRCLGVASLPHRVPVAVDVVEVAAAPGRPPVGVDRGVQVRAAGGDQAAVGLLPDHRTGERTLGGQPGRGVHQRCDVAAQPHVQPARRPAERGPGVAGVDGQPLGEAEPGRTGRGLQVVQVRPRPLGVDVVGGDRGHPAPVVDAGLQQLGQAVGVGEVGGRLQRHGGPQQEAGHGERGQVALVVEVVGGAHRRVGLGAEVLDDDLLHGAELAVHPADRQQGVHPLGQGLPDADEDAGGERHGQAPGVLQHPQADRRVLVGAAEVGSGRLGPQPARRGLQHHPHRGGDGLEPLDLLPAHHPRVEVRQQTGLLEDRDRAGPDVGQRVVVAPLVQPPPGLGPAVLGPVAQGEQRLLAAGCGAVAGDLQHLLQLEEGRRHPVGHGDEGAVVAAVPAQAGERDEDLAGVRDHAGAALARHRRVAHPAGGLGQRREPFAAGVEQHLGLGRVQGLARPGPGHRAVDLPGRGRHRRHRRDGYHRSRLRAGGPPARPVRLRRSRSPRRRSPAAARPAAPARC